jgi:transcriptional regulator with XRE-family HTH domain
MSVLDSIREAIRKSGKSQYAIGHATGIDEGQLSKFMRCQAGLSLANLEKILDYLNLQLKVVRRGINQQR